MNKPEFCCCGHCSQNGKIKEIAARKEFTQEELIRWRNDPNWWMWPVQPSNIKPENKVTTGMQGTTIMKDSVKEFIKYLDEYEHQFLVGYTYLTDYHVKEAPYGDEQEFVRKMIDKNVASTYTLQAIRFNFDKIFEEYKSID